jgi:hypothetical protein
MTRSEYHRLAPTYDPRDRLVEQIPQNINRAGKLYAKLIKKIYE